MREFLVTVVMAGLIGAGSPLAGEVGDKDLEAVLKVVRDGRPASAARVWSEPLSIRIQVLTNSRQRGSKRLRDEVFGLSLPLSWLESLVDWNQDRRLELASDCKIRLREVLRQVKRLKENDLLEIESENRQIRIWLE